MYSCVIWSNLFSTIKSSFALPTLLFDLITTLCERGANVVPNVVIHRCWYVFGSSQNNVLYNVLSQRCGDVSPTLIRRCDNVIVLAGREFQTIRVLAKTTF